jgi:hypothetical protein
VDVIVRERDSAREVLQQKERELEQLTDMLKANDTIGRCSLMWLLLLLCFLPFSFLF